MKLIAGVRWLLSLAARRSPRHRHGDPADMGTAFGLDATTTLESESMDEMARRESAPKPTRFELRLNRRSTL
jgi:hypothetical protein